MKLSLINVLLITIVPTSAAQSTLTFQDGLGGYNGTRDTGIGSTNPDVDAGQWQYFGWDNNVSQGTFIFQNGSGGYTGTSDTGISQAMPNTSAGDWQFWGWDFDYSDTVYPAWTLVRFSGLVGSGIGQFPPNSQIASAIFEYDCFNHGGPASVHEINSSWAESTTWNSFSHNYDSAATSTAGGGPQGICDLTQSVQAISNGAPNHGWVFIPETSDGVEAWSSEEQNNVGTKPSLTVITSEQDTTYSLISFLDIIGSATWQIPTGSTIQSAVLSYQCFNTGNDADLHEMTSSWSESVTWNIFQSLSYSPIIIDVAPGGMSQASCDVTQSIQAYLNGSPNLGWIFISTNDDGVEVHSSESPTQAQRPALEVTFTPPDPCAGATSNFCIAAPNTASATGAKMRMVGLPSISLNTSVLEATDCPAGQYGIFYYGPGQMQFQFGDGYRCVAGSVFRLMPPMLSSSAGVASRTLDYNAPPMNSGAGQINAGSTWNFQYWYRDPIGVGHGFNLSDGLEVTFCL